MERKMVKGGLYGFAIGLLIAIVLFPDQETIRFNGSTEVLYEPMRTYVFKLIRFSSLLSLLTILVVWMKEHFIITNKKTGLLEFMKGFIKSFIVVLAVILLASFFINMFR